VPSRAGSKNKRTLEYVQLYEELKAKHGCPVEALFRLAHNKRVDHAHRINAIKTLLPYRYAKRVEDPSEKGEQQEFELTWADESDAAEKTLRTLQ
jgi:hypothetical protein